MDTAQEHTPLITSKDNDFFKKIKSYSLAKNRKRDGVVLVEGKKGYREAAQFLPLRYTITSEDFSLSSFEGIPSENHTRLSPHLFNALSDTKTSQGIIGIFELPKLQLDLSLLNKVVVLEGIQDPGNVGTIIRTAFFLGYQAVLLDEACAAPFSPKVIRSSAGAVFHVPCVTAPIEAQLAALKEADFSIIGADLQGEDLEERVAGTSENNTGTPGLIKRAQKTALLFGSEGKGLSESALSYCDYRYRISAHNDAAESLNVAVASGIMMYQLNSLSGFPSAL